jgi:repressor LexA
MDTKLTILKKFFRRNHRLPSYKEMLKLFGFASKKAVYDVIQNFIKAGWLKKIDNKLAPTQAFFSLPLYGIVKAGFPILAQEDRQYMSLDEYLIEDPNRSFLLKVSGDSLLNIGIFDGDIVVVEKKALAYPGDIVLAEIDKEWTLKIYKKDLKKKTVYLEPANPKYPLLYPQRELVIHGVVKGVIRKIIN